MMQKKPAITLDEQVYLGLHSVIGRCKISHFIETVVRSHVLAPDLDSAYRQMAQDELREAGAVEWSEPALADVAEEAARE